MAKEFTQEDDELLAELGVEVETKSASSHTPREERIIAGFEEIQRFAEDHGRPPQHGEDRDIFERLYAVRLDRLREQEDCRTLLAPLDHQGLLSGAVQSPSIDADVLDDDALLAELGVEAEIAPITELKHVRASAEKRAAEEIANRERCEDFAKFKPLFEQVQKDLEIGVRMTRRFVKDAGFLVLKGNLFDSAIMKTSVISEEFRKRYLSNPDDPEAFEGKVAVFDGPEDYHARIDDPAENIDEYTVLVIRGAGPIGYPGAAEVVNMQPANYLIKKGILSLPCIGDGRQSGTSGSPSILNASPEAAAMGGLALLENGDRLRIDLGKGTANILISNEELSARREALEKAGGYAYPAHQTPWQEIQRGIVDQLSEGMVLKPAVKYQKVAETQGVPRDNH